MLTLSAQAILLGLAAAAAWGAADFAGGLATRRASPARVVLLAHGTSLLVLLALSIAAPAHLAPSAIAIALLSGATGGAALMLFYGALAQGAMGLSAALAGLLTALLPVLLAARSEGLPGRAQLAGFALALLSIALIAYAPADAAVSTRQTRRALAYSGLAGVGFGFQLILLHIASAGAHTGSSLDSVLRALTLSRVGGTAVALAALLLPGKREALRSGPALPLVTLAVLAGLLDTAGNAMYMLSSLGGRLDVAAVLSSLYPGGTILLAMIFLRERATHMQALGMALALAAVALIAA